MNTAANIQIKQTNYTFIIYVIFHLIVSLKLCFRKTKCGTCMVFEAWIGLQKKNIYELNT